MSKNKLLVNTILYVIGPQISKVVSILMMPLLTKQLTSFDYGAAGLIYAYTGLLGGLGDLGIHVRMANVYFKTPNKWRFIFQIYYGILSIWSIVFTILQIVLLVLILPNNLGLSKSIVLCLISITSLLFNTTINLNYRINQYREQTKFISIITVLSGIISIAINYVCIVTYQLGFLGWFIGSFVGSFIQFLFSFWFIYFKEKLYPIFIFKKRFLLLTLKATLPLIPHNYSTYLIDSSDRFLLNKMDVSMKNIGSYSFAYIFLGYFDFFISSVGMALSPLMAKVYFSKAKDSNKNLMKLILFILILIVAIGILYSLWMKELMILLVNNEDLKTTYPMVILMMGGIICRPLYWYTNGILTFNNATHDLWKISLSAGVFNFLFNLIFIPFYGIFASVIGTILSLIILGFSGYFLASFKKYNTSKFPITILIFFPLIFIFIYFLRDINPILKFLISFFITLILIYVYNKFTKTFSQYFN